MGAIRNLIAQIPWKRVTVALAVVGVTLLTLHFLVAPLSAYGDADLETQDRLSSIANLWVAVVTLLISAGLEINTRRRRAAPAGGGSGMTYAIPAGMASLKLPHHVPVDRVRGRDALLAELIAALDASGVHVPHGMGGAGKTTVAQRLA